MYILEPRCPTTKLSTKPTRGIVILDNIKGSAIRRTLLSILFNFDHIKIIFSCTTIRANPCVGHLLPFSARVNPVIRPPL